MLKNQKRRALFETRLDLVYIKEFQGDMLNYDESKARKRMAELRRKEPRTAEEESELDAVTSVITASKAVKDAWNQTKKLEGDLQNYIALL